MEATKNNIYIVRYRLNDEVGIRIKNFTNELEAYGFYHGLEGCSFKAMILQTTRVFTTPLLYEGSGFIGKKSC